jgi:hypothetical protein
MQRRNEDLKSKIARRQGVHHSPSKNPIVNLIKENQSEISELSQPFRTMFDQAVSIVSLLPSLNLVDEGRDFLAQSQE